MVHPSLINSARWSEARGDTLAASCSLKHCHLWHRGRPPHLLLSQTEEDGLPELIQPACYPLGSCYAEPCARAAATVPADAPPGTCGQQPARLPSAPDAEGDQTDDRIRNGSRDVFIYLQVKGDNIKYDILIAV